MVASCVNGSNSKQGRFPIHKQSTTWKGAVKMQVHIFRLATKEDAPELARLLNLLGHAPTTRSIQDCWDLWVYEGNSAFVAAHNDTLLGVATLHRMVVLHRSQPVGRITALVVDPAHRKQGIGRALVAHAEVALAQNGCGIMEITSRLDLADAHAFYETIGYKKTSVRLLKALDQD